MDAQYNTLPSFAPGLRCSTLMTDTFALLLNNQLNYYYISRQPTAEELKALLAPTPPAVPRSGVPTT